MAQDKQVKIEAMLAKFGSARVAVYGDFCLDAYWNVDPDPSEISIETGLPVNAVERHYYSPGGAANIVANLAALGPAAIETIGVLGDDIYGRELTTLLKDLGADTTGLVVQQQDFQTYTYLKRIVEGKEEPRYDFGVHNERSFETDEKILNNIQEALNRCDVLIFNQQVKNSLNNSAFIDKANQLFSEHQNRIVLVDSRQYNHQFSNIYRKVNDVELARLNGKSDENLSKEDLRTYGVQEFQRTNKPVFVTCGDQGMLAIDDAGTHEIPGISLTGELDSVGAGDTALSAIALSLASGHSPGEAAYLANLAAAVTVQKRFITGTATREEILQLLNNISLSDSIDHSN